MRIDDGELIARTPREPDAFGELAFLMRRTGDPERAADLAACRSWPRVP